jgi:hypothetical protein
MDTFRTKVSVPPAKNKIHFGHRILSIGSCFAVEAGQKFLDGGMQTLVNPWGTIFNTPALLHILQRAVAQTAAMPEHFTSADDRCLSGAYPSAMYGVDAAELHQRIHEKNIEVTSFLQQTDYLLLTLGTAWVYRHLDTGNIVASCHKMPAAAFEKILLSPEEQTASMLELIQLLRQLNPKMQCILTVSPVRHTRDTLPLNAVSKAVLRYACHAVTEQVADCSYFPAFEIMQDDLRDYRFYEADMIHPSSVAISYIWDLFSTNYFDAETLTIQDRISKLRQAVQHRPRAQTTAYYQQVLTQITEVEQHLGISLLALKDQAAQKIAGAIG